MSAHTKDPDLWCTDGTWAKSLASGSGAWLRLTSGEVRSNLSLCHMCKLVLPQQFPLQAGWSTRGRSGRNHSYFMPGGNSLYHVTLLSKPCSVKHGQDSLPHSSTSPRSSLDRQALALELQQTRGNPTHSYKGVNEKNRTPSRQPIKGHLKTRP